MKKIAVIGSEGFIGKHLVRRLSLDSQNVIKAFDKYQTFSSGEMENVQILTGDFMNRTELESAVAGSEYVFHLVSTTNPATSNKDPLLDIDTNIRGSVELFRICADQGVKKVLFFSSGGTVYGAKDIPEIDELTIPEPRSPYGIGKLTIEHYLRYFKTVRNLDYIVYRIANPYGPGQPVNRKQGVIPIFMNNIINGKPITIYGDGEMVRDYIYIEDLMDMIAGSFSREARYNVYNLGEGKGTSINELIQALEECVDSEIQKEYVEVPETFIRHSTLNIQRFISEFGFKPEISLRKGIAKTWEALNEGRNN
jgi:UDP-glucose 4-epimerase